MTNFSVNERKLATQSAIALAIVLTLFVFVKFVDAVSNLNKSKSESVASITVSGLGESFAIPDTAVIDFTVSADGVTVGEAQSKVTDLVGKSLEAIKGIGIDDKDVKTVSYVSNPKYSGTACSYYTCRYENQKIIGYTLSETIEVKVRDTNNTSAVLESLGSLGVTTISGPNYTVDDEDMVKAEARALAIVDAKEKAEVLAKDLDVRLVRITNFSENGDMPYYFAKDSMIMTSGAESAPSVPTGENKFTSTVSITYEIR